MKKTGLQLTCLAPLGILFLSFISQAWAEPALIKVGVLLSRTGGMADIGAEGEHGFELAIKDLKAKLDNEHYKVQFIFDDYICI